MRKLKSIISKSFAAVLAASMAIPSFAGTRIDGVKGQWKYDAIGWWWQNDDSSYPTNQWVWLDGNDDTIAECYYFDEKGYMVANREVDGYKINANGQWVDANGIMQTMAVNALQEKVSAQTTDDEGESEVTEDDSRVSDEIRSVIDDFKDTYAIDGRPDIEKELLILMYISRNCRYNLDSDRPHTAEGCLLDGEAVCDGYAKGFKIMAQECGLDAKYIQNKRHAWNMVKINGNWYHVDATYTDKDGSNLKKYWGEEDIDLEDVNLSDENNKKLYCHSKWGDVGVTAPKTYKRSKLEEVKKQLHDEFFVTQDELDSIEKQKQEEQKKEEKKELEKKNKQMWKKLKKIDKQEDEVIEERKKLYDERSKAEGEEEKERLTREIEELDKKREDLGRKWNKIYKEGRDGGYGWS